MLTIKTDDGVTITATNAAGLVAELNASSFQPCATPELFMREYAQRAYEMDDFMIRHTNAEVFIEDCIKYGVIKLLEDNTERK